MLSDSDHVVHDSWEILKYLEEKYPDRRSLFGPSGLSITINLDDAFMILVLDFCMS